MTRGLALLAVLLAPALLRAAETDAERARLLRPQALASAPGPATEADLRGAFADPPAEYRTMPLWVWNDEMQWERLEEQLAQFKAQGMGGVFVHPRPGLMTEYLGPEWFSLWKRAAAEGKRLGLFVNIYDENSYPSGFAGGHVPSRAPDTAAQYVQAELAFDPSAVRWGESSALARFAVESDGKGGYASMKRVREAREVPPGQQVATFRLRRAGGNPWTAEFPYVDLTNPEATRVFLETTYERYRQEIGSEFGGTVRWAFTDEPLLATAGAYEGGALSLPLSRATLAEFQRRNGYDLVDHLPSLYWDVGEFRRVRFDYWQTLHDLWERSFMQPMFEWCDRNGLQFTGHWMEHEWPYPWITPADANLYAYEHVPGIDALEGTELRLHGRDPHMLFTVRQVASVSHQLGRRVFCEAYGVAGWDSTFEHYKRFGDWLLVHGVDFLDQHLAYATARGARKRDHPQSFTDVAAWWPHYRLHADHVARVSLALARSEARHRVLVLQPTTSGFLLARRGAPTPELEAMRKRNAELNQLLADAQVDYDLGDEYMLQWFGRVEGKRLAIARAAYDLVVWPADMENLRSETLTLLERYLAAGGEVLALSAPAAWVDGRPSERPRDLAARHPGQWRVVASPEALLREIRTRLAPRIAFDRALPSSVGAAVRFLADGSRVVFLANTGLAPVRARATVEGGSLEVLDTVSGRSSPAVFSRSGRNLSFDVDLAPAGSALYLVRTKSAAPAQADGIQFVALPAVPWTAAAEAPNVLVLDYCDLRVGTETLADVNTWRANWTIWQRHGFERPAWDNAVQFRTRVFDRNHFPPNSGFEATFRFTIEDAGAIPGLELALETPELYRVSVNGASVDFGAGKRWLDPRIRSIGVESLARVGENTVVVAAGPFDVRMELENVYLRGRFAAVPHAHGFRLGAARGLALGSWRTQGLPFYADTVAYSAEVTLPAGTKQLEVALGEWNGSVAQVLLDGTPVATLGWPPWEVQVPATSGKHKVTVRIVSTPRNTFGPFHNPQKLRMRAWPGAWAEFPDHQPPGDAYDLLDYGLVTPPALSAGR